MAIKWPASHENEKSDDLVDESYGNAGDTSLGNKINYARRLFLDLWWFEVCYRRVTDKLPTPLAAVFKAPNCADAKFIYHSDTIDLQ